VPKAFANAAPVKLPAGVRLSLTPYAGRPRAALLIDRDGTLVLERNYLHRLADVRLQAGAATLVRTANAAGIAVAAVSNQSGIDRGLFGWDAYDAVEAEIDRRLRTRGAHLDARVANGYHPDYTRGWGARHAEWRKPGPRMLLLVLERLGVRPRRAWMLGDMASDVEAAKAAGLAGAVHVETGHGRAQREAALAAAGKGFPVLPARSIGEAQALLAAKGLFSGGS
jgi:D-glycero-D-manno-heptose 1,7-bisphosphate phosphatase